MLIILILFTCYTITFSQSKQYLLDRYCGHDLSQYCHLDHEYQQLLQCLHDHSNDISSQCLRYIGSSERGGCNEDAMTLCSNHEKTVDILQCLKDHSEKLSAQCKENIFGHDNSDDTAAQEKKLNQKRVTVFVTIISVLYLFIPLVLASWALQKFRSIYLLYTRLGNWSNPRRPTRQSPPTSESTMEERPRTPVEISFMGISVWFRQSSSSLAQPFVGPPPIRILNRIAGKFLPSEVSAIMGPSGSGKTTLLRLLGGRMGHGEFDGVRAINGIAKPPTQYDLDMRSQGFVPQYDVLLSELTVWQTMVYSALLRMPVRVDTVDKIMRARRTLIEMGLSGVAESVVGSNTMGTSSASCKGISGGQRRRLAIAQELLGSPSVLFLDEPTSGLDSTTSLRLMDTLLELSRSRGSTVVLSIHQPRAEVFEMFDNLILLGQKGRMVYSGPGRRAKHLLSLCPAVTLDTGKYDNPGDFIIDVLGLGGEEEERQRWEQRTAPSNTNSTHTVSRIASTDSDVTTPPQLEYELDTIEAGNEGTISDDVTGCLPCVSISRFDSDASDSSSDRRGENLTHELSTHFLRSTEFALLVSSIERGLVNLGGEGAEGRARERVSDLLHRVDLGKVQYTPLNAGMSIQDCSADSDDEEVELNPRPAVRAGFSRVTRTRGGYAMPPIIADSTAGRSLSSAHGGWLERMILQLWVLFARRVTVFHPRPSEVLVFCAQNISIAVIISLAFSYDVVTALELPYQVLMLIFILSSYAMILQYLTLVPEYYTERAVISMEKSSGIISYIPYVLSALLTEVPRAILQCCLLNGILYMIHPLNPELANATFSFVCLMVGVCAWQSIICVCAVVSDNISVAYTVSFLMLGLGTLFGGLLVGLSKIPLVFRFVYYLSVTAVTQRALVANDMQCCYLSVSCNSLVADISRNRGEESSSVFSPYGGGNGWNHVGTESESDPSAYCPPELHFTGDGSDEGNLGRLALQVLDLQHTTPIVSLFFLFWANILCRGLAVIILSLREKFKYRLVQVDEDRMTAMEQAGPRRRNFFLINRTQHVNNPILTFADIRSSGQSGVELANINSNS